MKITDEMVETAAKALHHIDGTGTHPQWDLEWDYVKADYLLQARGALEAVAPLIAAQALREAADAPTCDNVPDGAACLACDTRMFLREAADRIEAGQ